MRSSKPGSFGPGFFVLGLLAGACGGGEEPAAPRDDILQVALDVARRDRPDLDEPAVRAEIDRLAAAYRKLAPDTASPAQRADALRRLLFEQERFQAVTDLTSAEALHIDSVLKRKKGYCLSLSVVALAVAEKVGAPLHGVAAPNHFFVRYDDGRFRRNLELTRKGVEVTDAELRRRFGKDLGAVYLRNLGPREVRACLVHNRGFVAMVAKRPRRARADFDEAIRLLPELSEAHRNLGVLLGEQKDWEGARRASARALSLYPADVDALINLALCRHALGDPAAARQDLEMALQLEPEQKRAHELLRRWREEELRRAKTTTTAREALPAAPAGLRPGLRGRYYRGTGFQALVTERVDRTIDFDWKNASPARGVPRDRFSVRWEGYLKAPRTGVYTFFVAANDGARLKVGDGVVLENWRDMGYRNWYGSQDVRLAAGWHKIRIEHYDIFGGARCLLRVGVEGREDPLPLAEHLFHVRR